MKTDKVPNLSERNTKSFQPKLESLIHKLKIYSEYFSEPTQYERPKIIKRHFKNRRKAYNLKERNTSFNEMLKTNLDED